MSENSEALSKIEFCIIYLCLTGDRHCSRKFAKELILKIKAMYKDNEE